MKKYKSTQLRKAVPEDVKKQREAAEEYIAHLAQKGVPKPSWWKEFIQKIRMWWSNTRWGKEYPMTNEQIEVLLARSSRKMRKRWYNRRSVVQDLSSPKAAEEGGSSSAEAAEDGDGLRFAIDEKPYYQIPFADSVVKNAIDKENNGTPSILYAQKKAESMLNAEGVQFPNRYAFDSVNHNIADVG